MKKRCTKCGIEKPTNAFNKSAAVKCGLRSVCRLCQNEAGRKYRTENLDKVRRKERERKAENLEKIKEDQRKWRQKNKAYTKAYAKKYYKENIQKFKEARRNAYKKLKEDRPKYKRSLARAADMDRKRRAVLRYTTRRYRIKVCDKNNESMIILKKICWGCKIEKPLYAFHKASAVKGGFKAECKLCGNKRAKIYRLKNLEAHRARDRQTKQELRPCYVRGLLAQNSILNRSDIPDELVEVKRLEIQIQRFLKGEDHEQC